jgi:hypothetical protein
MRMIGIRIINRLACLILMASSTALAQEAADFPVSVLPELSEKPPLVAWALAVLFLVGSLAIAFKSSKRGHLD